MLDQTRAQTDYTWWNNIHQWDGITPWVNYIKLTPGGMGPNALPVPEMQNGKLDTALNFTLAPEVYLAKNDFTADVYTELKIPIENRVVLRIWWVPFEYFNTDTIVRDFRAARTKDAYGTATGDVYIGTQIKLVENHKFLPDAVLGINLKTASGSRVYDARTTDTPGYFFDLTLGKTWRINAQTNIRPYANLGFLVYQTYRDDYYQNDALLWGFGTDFTYKQLTLKAQFAGYKGYFDDLDKPVVFRAEANLRANNLRYFFRYQIGNESYNYTNLRAGITFYLLRKK